MRQGDAQGGQGVEILAQASGRRTIRGKRRSPSNTSPASRPPMAIATTSCTSATFKPIPGNSGAVNEDTQDGQASRLFDLHVRRARDTLEHLGNRRCCGLHGVKVIAIDLDGHVAAHAGNEFVKAHLDGLRELVVMPRDLLKGFFHTLDQGAFRLVRMRPLVTGLENDKGVGDVRWHGVGSHFSRARFGKHQGHLRKRAERLFDLRLHLERLRQRRAGNTHGVGRNVLLVQRWDKLLPQGPKEQHGPDKRGHRQGTT